MKPPVLSWQLLPTYVEMLLFPQLHELNSNILSMAFKAHNNWLVRFPLSCSTNKFLASTFLSWLFSPAQYHHISSCH